MSNIRRCRYCNKILPKGSWFFCPDREYPKPSSCTRRFEEEWGDILDEADRLLQIMRIYKPV